MTPPDAAARARALDISRSFLVQAPAGSGKTELLTQRFLALLGVVEEPESIVAITFTNKAAGEMRNRVGDALRLAKGPRPDEEHKVLTWELASRALERNRERQWGLEENTNRLRILTLDALCATLASQMPWLSRLGGPPAVSDDTEELHREAALRTLALLDTPLGDPVRRLLLHIDNNHPRALTLLAAMLAKRDQWLRHYGGLDRAAMERVLAEIVRRGEDRAREAVPAEAFVMYRSVRGTEPTLWELADFLLTAEGSLRKSVDKRHGFPPGHPRKLEMIAFLKRLPEEMAEPLAAVRALPDSRYSDAQWELIQALFDVLKLAVAQLRLLFQERGEVDFIEVTLASLHALGTDADPTPLAYSLDYRMQHLLIDEFQDTSVTKLRLLERLTAEWTPDDGRTLFAVGDPMQSIYSFQEAEVSLFERCRRDGLGAVQIEPLQLTANFRSTRTMVDWFNSVVPRVMGLENNDVTGAVAYAPSIATHAEGGAANVHSILKGAIADETARVAQLVEQANEGTVAILVAKRAAAFPVLRELRRRGIRYQAVEMDRLRDRPAVRDLHALTRAMLHPDDRVARLSVLRAPWAGLTLEQLLAGPGELEPVSRAYAERGRKPLRQWVEDTWRELGGPACLRDETEREDAGTYLQFLETAPEDLAALESALDRAWAPPDPQADGRIQIMTIHKAKGLEFETVILPGLGLGPGPGDHSLLRWREFGSGEDLVIGSVREFGEEPDRVYSYLGGIVTERQEHERNRLFYVAVTRARRTLHLVGWRGEKRSMSARLPFLFEDVPAAAAVAAIPAEPPKLRRLAAGWQRPPAPAPLQWPVEEHRVEEEDISYDWSGETTRLVGTAVHAVLCTIGREGLERWTPAHLVSQQPAMRASLASLGVPSGEWNAAMDRMLEAIQGTLLDPRGRWILASHTEARNEWELSAVFGTEVRHLQLDRSFVDEEGTRWIIDYKTSTHQGGNVEGFLDNELERYRAQLERYAAAVSRLDARPIRLGLYFPLLGGWREWAYARPAIRAAEE